MGRGFPGFSPKALSFFRQLAKNKRRDWFAAHKEQFQADVRRPMVELVTLLCEDMRRLAADYVPDKPEKAIYRIYRDTRFSHDKTPYKTHISAHFQHRRVTRNEGAGFYFQVSHEGLDVGGGMYMPGPEQLLAVRQALSAQWQQFARLCEDRALLRYLGPLQGQSLARVPKGFDPQSPAAEWLKRKQLFYYVELDAKLALGPGLRRQVMNRFERVAPMVQFLNEAIIAGTGSEEEVLPVRPEPMF
jgi:uncharacterized protein (TIGR02453 family)